VSENLVSSTTLTCEQFYHQLHTTCGSILTSSFAADDNNYQAKSHHFISDLQEWIVVLSSRGEAQLLKAALREYEFALLALVQGQYRQAFMALRLFLELALAAVALSANELELQEWLNGNRDINWQALVDDQNGVLGKRFVTAFHQALVDEAPQYRTIAAQVYRECSEYVHGNAQTAYTLPEKLQFMKEVFLTWHEKARSIRLVVVFALCSRYLLMLDETMRSNLETSVLDELGHIAAIRRLYGGVTEGA